MDWLMALVRPITVRLWMAYFGVDHTMTVRICTSPHVFVAWVDWGGRSSDPMPKMPAHLDLELKVWKTGGRDVTIIDWQPPAEYIARSHKTDQVLKGSGEPVTITTELDPKTQPLKAQPGDPFALVLTLNNRIPLRFKARVTS